MLNTTKIRALAMATVVAALSVTSAASAATVNRAGTPVKPIVINHTHIVAAVSAFPAGGRGSGTEATCGLWSQQLNLEQGAVNAAVANNDLAQYQEASEALNEDKNNAQDAGCVVID